MHICRHDRLFTNMYMMRNTDIYMMKITDIYNENYKHIRWELRVLSQDAELSEDLVWKSGW